MRTPSPELDPTDIGFDLIPPAPIKQAGETSISFNGVLSPPLRLHEDLKEGCGGQLWPAGMVLAKYLLARPDEWRDKKILELGAGGGLVGLALALQLKQSSSAPSCPFLITDLPILVPLIQHNIALNDLPSTHILAASLPWGDDSWADAANEIPSELQHPEIILAADCVYFEPAFPLLMQTLRRLLTSTNGSRPTCFFCMKKRRKADMRFVAELKKVFEVSRLEFERTNREDDEALWEEEGRVMLFKVVARE